MSLDDALALARRIDAKGPLYVVGGTLRDHLLGRPSPDLDLACAEAAEPLARRVARRLGGSAFVLDAEHGVWRVALKDGPIRQVDLARLEGGAIESDLARRDFTMNAMALLAGAPPSAIIDPYGGRQDVKDRLVRMVSPKAFTDDGLRLLRAFRFASELGLEIEPKTLKAIGSRRAAIRKAAGERVQGELLRFFEGRRSAPLLRRMEACGLLTTLMPELARQRRCARVYYGEDGVMGHSLLVVERLERLFATLREVYPEFEPKLLAWLESRRTPAASHAALLKLTALIHDIAKPATAKPVGGRLRFFGHEELGAEMAERLLERLRFSREQRRAVALMIRHHLRPGNLAANPVVSDKAVFRFFEDLGQDGVGLLLVCWGDYASYLTDPQLAKVLALLAKDPRQAPGSRDLEPALVKTHRHLQVVHLLLNAWFKRKKTVSPPRLVDGNDVMKLTGLPPGPDIGRILGEVREAQAEGRLSSREQVLSFLRTLRRP